MKISEKERQEFFKEYAYYFKLEYDLAFKEELNKDMRKKEHETTY